MTTFDAETTEVVADRHGHRSNVVRAAVAVEARHCDAELRYFGPGRHVKRVLDVAAATVAIVVAFPLLVAVALVVATTSAGPPMYGQRRVGRHGVVFRCWKFRTMFHDAERRLRADPQLWQRYVDDDFKLSGTDDPRVTPVGRFLRRTSLDELPQLLNVLAGSMSLVGPRPVVPEELACYGPLQPAYLAAKPGITGPWQCGGRNTIKYPLRAHLDADYLATWSFGRDLVILARTVPAVLRRDGAK